jgi:hypothetical protein
MTLQPQHRLFAEVFVACGDVAEAYRTVYSGVSAEVARVNGFRLLRRRDVREAVRDLEGTALHERTLEKIAKRAAVEPADVIKELVCVAFADATELFEPQDPRDPGALKLRHPRALPQSVRRAIQSVRVQHSRTRTTTRLTSQAGQPATVEDRESVSVVEYKLHSKLDALRAIGQHLGLFKELPPLDVLLVHVAAEHGQQAADLLKAALASAAARAKGQAKLASDKPAKQPEPSQATPPPAPEAAAVQPAPEAAQGQPASTPGEPPTSHQAAEPGRVRQQTGGNPGHASGPPFAFQAAPVPAREVADEDDVLAGRRPTREEDVVGGRPRHVPRHGTTADED